ncbi:hypothetical protein, partial [Pseudomonas sp. FG-3G]
WAGPRSLTRLLAGRPHESQGFVGLYSRPSLLPVRFRSPH